MPRGDTQPYRPAEKPPLDLVPCPKEPELHRPTAGKYCPDCGARVQRPHGTMD